MESLKRTFTSAATGKTGFSIFWLLMFAIAIIDDSQAHEKEKRNKRERHAKAQCKPLAGPRPF